MEITLFRLSSLWLIPSQPWGPSPLCSFLELYDTMGWSFSWFPGLFSSTLLVSSVFLAVFFICKPGFVVFPALQLLEQLC